MIKPIEDMNKDELEAFARKEYGHELDKRRRLDDLIEHVKALASRKDKPVHEKPLSERTPKRVRHLTTGMEWEWNPLYKGNQDLEIIEWS